jgi:hypothetical protein
MTDRERLVTWREVPTGRLLADLPDGCFASIEWRETGIYHALIGCDGDRMFVLTDSFDTRDVAQAWVEDKARLLDRGIDILATQSSTR